MRPGEAASCCARFHHKNSWSAFFRHAHSRREDSKLARTIRDMAAVKECISHLTARVPRHTNVSTAPVPVFLASDFAEYG